MVLRRHFSFIKVRSSMILCMVPSLIDVDHACYYSPVLKAAFTSSFVEGQTQTYRLEDTDPDIFRLLVQWFYTQHFKHIPSTNSATALPNDELHEKTPENSDNEKAKPKGQSFLDRRKQWEKAWAERDSVYLNVTQLYILAERFIIPRLQNYIMDSLIDMSTKSWSTAWMATAYGGTTPNSPLRRFVVDMLLFQVPQAWKKSHADDLPRDLLVDFAAAVTLSEDETVRCLYNVRANKGYMVPVEP
jgi:hypothetical protein